MSEQTVNVLDLLEEDDEFEVVLKTICVVGNEFV
jgi:hypothetical protein